MRQGTCSDRADLEMQLMATCTSWSPVVAQRNFVWMYGLIHAQRGAHWGGRQVQAVRHQMRPQLLYTGPASGSPCY